MLQGGLGDFKLFICLLVAKGTGDAVAAAITEKRGRSDVALPKYQDYEAVHASHETDS